MIFKSLLVGIALIAAAILVLKLLFPLPVRDDIRRSTALPPSTASEMGRRKAEGATRYPGQTGILPLVTGADALGSRMALIAGAERSIDVQYYIWHDDTSGRLMLNSLIEAAQRGVRVRLLLDDNGVDMADETLAALDALDNFEVRLFNPATLRSPKLVSFAFDFLRMNRRMHNKALIVDGAAAIVGGRNIGDEYFDIGNETPFLDLDVLALGPVVDDTAESFDAYWNSQSAYPVPTVIAGKGSLTPFRADLAAIDRTDEARDVRASLESTVEAYRRGERTLEWTAVRLVVDDPAKGLGQVPRDKLMMARLGDTVGPVDSRIDIISAYFIVGKQGARWIEDLARSGKRVRIATNALNTTDVPAVHAGYARYRPQLLAAGAELYEIRLGAVAQADARNGNALGVSHASLHAKSFAVDGRRAFIGSFNFDPRSILLNCEMGYVIESPQLAEAIGAAFDRDLPQISYRPALDSKGRLIWTERHADNTVLTHDEEPDTTLGQRLTVGIVRQLPIEWML